MSAFMLFDADESIDLAQARAELAPRGAECVYFIAAGFGPSSRVKIGKCTGHPRARMAQLQTGSSERLRLETFFLGTRKQEREMHARFAAFRIHPRAEWFRREGELLSFIKALRASMDYGEAVLSQRAHFALEVTP